MNQDIEQDMANDSIANDADNAPIYRGSTENVPPGTMCMANASRFVESNFNVPLTTFATGWKDPNRIDLALEFVAPMVSVGRFFTFIQSTNAEEFISEVDDTRGIGADFKRVEYTSTKQTSQTINKGLTIRIDKDEVNDLPNFQEIYTGRMMRRLLRNELRRSIAVLGAAAVAYGGSGADLNPRQLTWTQTPGTDPDQDLIDATDRYADGAGIYPTRALFSKVAWNARLRAFRGNNNPGGYQNANMTEQQVADFLGLDGVYVSKERYTTGTRLAPTKAAVMGQGIAAGIPANTNPVLLYLAEAGQTPEDPSNIKRFVSATEGGTPFRVYVEQKGAKFIEITVEHYSCIIATSTLGVQLLNIALV